MSKKANRKELKWKETMWTRNKEVPFSTATDRKSGSHAKEFPQTHAQGNG